MENIINAQLKKNLSKILENKWSIELGNLSGNSIELIDNPLSYTSYTYYDRESDRDNDFLIVSKLLNSK